MDDEHHQKNESSIILRSTVPFIEIDSLFIDLTSYIDKPDAGNCDHFSIRGYASQMREKDWKRCWPFDLDGEYKSEETTSLLPPFHVPDIRWWRCQKCRKEAPAGFEQPSNLDKIDRSVAVANTTNLCSLTHPLSISIEKEKKAEGNEIDSRRILNPEIPILISVIPEVGSTLMLEQNKSDPECRESIENYELLCGNEVAEVELGLQNLKVIDENPKVFDEEKETSAHNGQTEITSLVSGAQEFSRAACNSESDPANAYPAELDETNATASEYTEISVGNDFQDHHTDKSGSLHHRKTRKMRLLTELLNENEKIKTNHLEKEESPSHGTPEKSEGLKDLSVYQCPVTVKKNVKSLGQNMKYKLPLDEDCLPPEVSSSYKMNNKIQVLKGVVETKDSIHVIESENELIGMGLRTKKSLLNKCRIDGKSIHGKKKNKKTQLDVCPSLNIPPESGDNMSNISLKHNEFPGSSVDPFLLFGSRIEPISCMSKKKNKMLVIDEGRDFPGSIGMPRRDSVALKEVEIRNNERVAVPCPSVPDESSERGLHLSLNSYLATPRNDKKSIPQAKGSSRCMFSWQGSTSTASGVRNKDVETKNLKDSNVPFNYSDNFPGLGVHSGSGSKMTTCRMHFLNEKQNSNFQVEDDSWSQLQPMDNSVVNKEKSVTVQEHLAAKMKQGDQTAGQVSEQRALDDIPMEIVELMAKNQYERCLDDTENYKPSSKTGSRKAQIMNFSNACGNSGSSQEKMNHKWKPQIRNGRNGIFIAGDDVGYGKQSSGDYFSHTEREHFNMNHLHQALMTPEYTAFLHSQNNLSNGVKFLASGTHENGCAQYSKYAGGMADQESSDSRVQAFGGCNTHLPVSPKSEEIAHLWPETLPNHHSYVSTTPKKVAAQSTSINVCTDYTKSSSKGVTNREPDLKFFNLNAANLEKDDGNYGFENFSRTNAKHPFACHSEGIELPRNLMGSLDLYSNETIPAMHLLSLMDAGMQHSETHGTPKFPKKPSSHDLKAKEISRLDIGLHKTIDTINYSCDYYGEIHPSKKSHDCFHAASVASASISPFIRNESFDVAGLTAKVALQSKQKETTKCPTSMWNRGQKSQKSIFASGVVGSNKGVFPSHSLQKKFSGGSSSWVAMPGYHGVENPGQCIIERHGTKRTLEHLDVSSEFGICSINKNPAEFSIPEAGNMYMIGADDLEFSKRIPPEKGSGLVNMDGRKRRNVKRTVVKEHALRYNL